MTKSGNNYIYEFCNTSNIGDYSYTTCGDKSGNVAWTGQFTEMIQKEVKKMKKRKSGKKGECGRTPRIGKVGDEKPARSGRGRR